MNGVQRKAPCHTIQGFPLLITVNSNIYFIKIPLGDTLIPNVKLIISELLHINPHSFQLLYNGQQLLNIYTLDHYRIPNFGELTLFTLPSFNIPVTQHINLNILVSLNNTFHSTMLIDLHMDHNDLEVLLREIVQISLSQFTFKLNGRTVQKGLLSAHYFTCHHLTIDIISTLRGGKEENIAW